jgi:hypothetical protein
MQVEIINPQGKVAYRRPHNHPDVLEALNTPGYYVRGAEPKGEPQVRISDGLAIKSLEQLIDSAAENLPAEWEIRIDVQREYGEVIVTRPDGSECPMADGENDMREQFRDALCLIRDELEADRLLNA